MIIAHIMLDLYLTVLCCRHISAVCKIKALLMDLGCTKFNRREHGNLVLLIVKKDSTSSLILLQRLREGITKIVWHAARHNTEKRLCFFAKLAPESLGYTLELASNHTTPSKITFCRVFISFEAFLFFFFPFFFLENRTNINWTLTKTFFYNKHKFKAMYMYKRLVSSRGH